MTSSAAGLTPASAHAPRAPSSSRLVTSSLYWLTMMAMRPAARRRPWISVMASEGEKMAKLVALGLKIVAVLVRPARDQRDPLHDLKSVSIQSHQLARVVGHDLDGGEPEVAKDLRTDAIVAEIRCKTQPLVGRHRVGPRILQGVGAELVEQADASPLLIEIPVSYTHLRAH